MIKEAEIQVRFADCDIMGHVNNAVYLSYFEQARMHYFSGMVGDQWDWKKQGVILVKNEVEYLAPIFLHDTPKIKVLLESIGTKSFTLAYEVFVNGKIRSKGKSTLVCFDFYSQSTTEVFPEVREGLKMLEKCEA